MQQPTSPIGVFDSGVGGLSILKAIRKQLPNENLLYIADSANAPYGDRDPAFISKRALEIADFLYHANAKAIVVACNTATVVAIDALRAAFTIPIVAVEPAIKPAAALTRSGVVAVLATSRTLASSSVAKLCERYGDGIKLMLQPCPGLVEQIERGQLASPQTLTLLESYLEPVLAAGADTIVLGCTHYPFLEPQIRAIAGNSVTILDSAEAVARQLQRIISQANPNKTGSHAKDSFITTGDTATTGELITSLWGSRTEVQPML